MFQVMWNGPLWFWDIGGVEVKEEVLGGGGGKQKEKEQSEINCLSCARSHTLILSCFCVQSTASPFTFN